MAVTFHPVPVGARGLACDVCFCMVDPSEEGRAGHQASHERAAAPVSAAPDVLDLTEAREARRSPAT